MLNDQIFEPKSNLVLAKDDVVYIPAIDNTITVLGSVQQESIIAFEKSISFKQVINASGGISENADLKKAYIEYQNGLKKSVKSFLGIRNYPKVMAGSKIFVPNKSENKNKTSVAEIVGYTTSLVSIVALLKSF